MKKWRIILSAVLITAAAAACTVAVGCKKSSHNAHTYSSAWSSDRYTHWHEPTCNDTDERGDEAGHTWGADKKCTVCGMVRANGIEVLKTKTVYRMETKKAINVAVDDLTVNLLKDDGSVDRAMTADEYTVSYYKGKTKIDSLNGIDEGSYNIWVEAVMNDQVVDSCVVVYVTDEFTNLVMVSGETEQVIGGDVITPTWKFQAELLSGNKIDLDVSKVNVANFSTFEIAAASKDHYATVSYKYVDALGETTEKSTRVEYAITEPEGNVEVIRNNFSYDAITGITADKQQIKPADMTGVNAFITVTDVADFQWRSASGKYVEIQGSSLEVEFKGTGVFKIKCASTSSTNVSAFALIDEENNYINATYTSKDVTEGYDNAAYAINGNSGVDFSFTINKPGKYKLCQLDEISTVEDFINTKRYLRIWSISMVDIAISAAEVA